MIPHRFIITVIFIQELSIRNSWTLSYHASPAGKAGKFYSFRHAGYPKFPARYTKNSACSKNIPMKPMQKIVGGAPVGYGAYPWMVHLESLTFEGFDHACGGAIVSEYFIVTAAHCIHGYGYREVRVKVGDYDSTHKDSYEKIFEVDSWKVHSKFQKDAVYDNDIAVIKIKPFKGRGIVFNEYVSPVCLPSEETPYTPDTLCYVSGWGLTNPEDLYPSTILRAASVPIIADDVCSSPGVLGAKKIRPGMMCAGYIHGGAVDACNGDSGGPLVCYIDGEHTLLGVVSWGIDCAKPNKPGVYSNVKFYLEFINKAMEDL